MSRDHSHDVDTLHPQELERFTTELIQAGFEPQAGDRHSWRGPINSSLGAMTAATEMVIDIRDGWPYQHPYLFVDGLIGRRHVSADNNVCLWDENEEAYEEWLSLEAVENRITAWCVDQTAGAPECTLDAHLYFKPRSDTRLIAFDLERLESTGLVQKQDGSRSDLRAAMAGDILRVGETGELRVAWYRRSALVAPPADRSSFREALTSDQRAHFDRFGERCARRRLGLAILNWEDGESTNALALELGPSGAVAIQIARTDAVVMRLRAGQDGELLAKKHATILGVGAIGSEIAITLARCGIGSLSLVDYDLLRPSNLTRHAASGTWVGLPKVEAMRRSIADALLPVRVETIPRRVWEARPLEVLVDKSDVVLEATGNGAYADMVSTIAESRGRRLLSVALYREGLVARIRVQGGTSFPIWRRDPASGFPNVPAGTGSSTSPRWETGCGAPVNNAPPWSTLAIAALASRTALDVLTGRLAEEVDIVEVYQPIEKPPFDKRGLLEFRSTVGGA